MLRHFQRGVIVRPKPFIAEPVDRQSLYIRDKSSGLVWHRCQMRTLYADTDRSQVVYHAHYLRYFEFGRASLMRDAAYPYRQIEESGYIYPIIMIICIFIPGQQSGSAFDCNLIM